MNETLRNSFDIETHAQSRAEFAQALAMEAYPLVMAEYDIKNEAHFGGSYLNGEAMHTVQNDSKNILQMMTNTGGR